MKYLTKQLFCITILMFFVMIITVHCGYCAERVGGNMEILHRLFGKKDKSPMQEEGYTNIALVLLSEARLPDAQDIVKAYGSFETSNDGIKEKVDDKGKSSEEKVMVFQLGASDTVYIGLMPLAVPNREAEGHAQFSVSSIGKTDNLRSHCAHLIVKFDSHTDETLLVKLSRFTSFLAAVVRASPAVGVYWGYSGATYDAIFFLSVAPEHAVVDRIALWSGVSITYDKGGQLNMLSLGMKQLKLPDLLLVAGKTSIDDVVVFFYQLLAYVAERGKALPEGHTVGRSSIERLRVHYVQSPADPAEKVWRVEMP